MKRLFALFFILINFVLYSSVEVDIFPVGKKQSTGIYVKKGDKINITATGKWSLWNKYVLTGPEGHPVKANEYGNWGILLGKIGGGEIFVVSNQKDLTSDTDGILYLFPNKGKFLIEKESGSIRASINGGIKIEDLVSSLSTTSKKIVFDPKQGVLNTNLFFNEGENIEIYAFGTWNMWDGVYKETNAEGHIFEFNPENIPWGKLYGGLGSSYSQLNETFSIGEKVSYTTRESGILSLYPYLSNYESVVSGMMDIYIIGGREATEENKKSIDEKIKNSSSTIALTRLNEYRNLLKLPLLESHPILSQTAFDHSKYIVLNGSFLSNEEEGKINFTGVTFQDRLNKADYKGRAREMFCQIESVTGSVDLFFDSVYHRLRLMDPDLKYLGYGSFKGKDTSIHVYDFGYRPDSEKEFEWDAICYPIADSKDNKVSWDGTENPSPFPVEEKKTDDGKKTEKDLYGFPITLLLKELIASVSQAELIDKDGKVVDCFVITPDTDINNKQINAVVLVPKKSLLNESKYTVNVTVKYSTSGEKSYNWSFETAKK